MPKKRMGIMIAGDTMQFMVNIPNKTSKACNASKKVRGKISSIAPTSLENLLSIRPEKREKWFKVSILKDEETLISVTIIIEFVFYVDYKKTHRENIAINLIQILQY